MTPFSTLTEYAHKVMVNKNNPRVLSDLQLEMAAKYGMLSDVAKDIQIEKAEWTNAVKFANDKPLSDTSVEHKWRLEEGGKKELKIKYELKALEKLMSACNSANVVSAIEARNQF